MFTNLKKKQQLLSGHPRIDYVMEILIYKKCPHVIILKVLIYYKSSQVIILKANYKCSLAGDYPMQLPGQPEQFEAGQMVS